MSIYRRAAKRDRNEPEIVHALEDCGVEVHRRLPVDLLCLTRGRILLLEVKDEEARPRKDQPEQAAFIRRHGIQVVRTIADALAAVGAMHQPRLFERPADANWGRNVRRTI